MSNLYNVRFGQIRLYLFIYLRENDKLSFHVHYIQRFNLEALHDCDGQKPGLLIDSLTI